MSEAVLDISTQEQKKEIINILVDSALYLDMDQTDQQELLNYLVTSYCRQPAK